jgi:hypothetical protein
MLDWQRYSLARLRLVRRFIAADWRDEPQRKDVKKLLAFF